MNPKNKILVDRVIDSMDWEVVLKIYKMMKRSVGEEPAKIPGVKKLKKGEKLYIDSIKEEVLAIVNYAIENDLPELAYGPWSISWVNGEWEIDISDESENEEAPEEDRVYVPIRDSVLEIFFVPVMAISQERVERVKSSDNSDDDQNDLNIRLENAIKEENYELASKIRDLMNSYKNKK
jgi:hypothetical protein